jgi:hypothetical protein
MPLETNPSVGTTGGGLCDPGNGGTPSGESSGGTATENCYIQRVQDEGTLVDCEPILNFIGSGVTVTRDSANNRINITFS